ncbi:terminase gpA endonuclease subunit [Pseudomonas sp. Irchel 3A5]|uniref:terminase gpA endonuclease subunit n=1 Tax=Pseudomonas sp. Irchel 3A5 TaxID=2008911 RepID=UPI000BA3C35E|nr:terminase gpA endonuclease subunit [Pseudomonas sp. Irchel 3A5]
MTYVDEWAAEHMYLPPAISTDPGPYLVQRTPYAREPMRCLSMDHPCKRVVVMAATQLMKTQVAVNWLGSLVDESPSNILVFLPSRHHARRMARRINGCFTASPILRERWPRRGDPCEKSYEGGSLRLISASSLAFESFPADYVCAEQIDHWPLDTEFDIDLVEAAERCHDTSIMRPKFYFSGVPTVKSTSRIDVLFSKSDQRHYYVPCSHCSHMQTLDWERLQYSSDFHQVHYSCFRPDCGAAIEEEHLGDMLAKGEWRSHADGDGETVGFHLNALYAPTGWWGWGRLAKQYEHAKEEQLHGDPSIMRMFYNVFLAKVWDDTGE